MRWTHGVRARMGLLRRDAAEARMDEEMRFHVEMETEKNLRAGMSPAEARRQALLAFGGTERHREAMRDGRTLAWAEGLSLDLKLGARMLVKHRGLSLIGGFAMAIAIAVGAMAFEVVSEVLNPALPLDGGDRVVALQLATDNPGNPERRVLHDFAAWRQELRSVGEVGAFRTTEHNLVSGDGPPVPVKVAEMSAAGFRLARTPPLLGRYLVPEDERPDAPPVVVIREDVWRTRFGGDPRVVGRTIQLGATPHVVAGVMPATFRFPMSHRLWVPLRADPARHALHEGPQIYVFGRLAPGVTLQEAQAELTALGERRAAADPRAYERLRPTVLAYTHEHLDVDHPLLRGALRVLQLLVGGLLVVVAVNLAILLYARTVARMGEIAVRSALGASRRRILAQLFLEAFALSALGAVAGLLLARGVLGWVRGQLARLEEIPFWIRLDLSAGTVVYALALSVLAAAIMGVLPGLKATGSRMNASLRELGGGGGGTRLGRVWTSLIVAQVAIAVAVLPVAVLTVWQVVRMEIAEVGFPAEEFVAGMVGFGEDDAAAMGEALEARFGARQAALADRLAAEPGVASVAFSSGTPGVEGLTRRIELEGGGASPAAEAEAGALWAGWVQAGPGLFEAYDARILAGRPFGSRDLGGGAATVIVNRAFVRRFLGGRPAVGRRFRYPSARTDLPGAGGEEAWYEIVGVVEDFPAVPLGLFSPADGVPNVYHPAAPGRVHPAHLSVRFRGGIPDGFAGRIREVAAEVDPALQVSARPLEELYGSLRAGSRFAAWGLAAVTLSVLLLSAAGIYALMSFTVAQRAREIGIRAALGALPGRILAGIFGRVARQLALGLVLGSLAAGALFTGAGVGARRTAALLLAVAAIMGVVGLLAAMGPARRGLRIQPSEALREA